MSEENIPAAFAKFRQIDSDLNREYEGTGLGLTLARGLTKLHGGTIGIESKLGHGTAVTVRLPGWRIIDDSDSETGIDTETGSTENIVRLTGYRNRSWQTARFGFGPRPFREFSVFQQQRYPADEQ